MIDSAARRFSIIGLVLAFVCAAGMAMAIALLYQGMAVIMQTEGGFVASGGPYVIAHPAPGWNALIPVSILGLFLFGGINIATSSRGWGVNLVLFAWMALFIALGWNFLRFGLNPPEDMQGAWAWVLCGVLFWVMGFAPAILIFRWARVGFQGLIDRQPNSDARRTWRIPTTRDTTGVYIAAQALGAVAGVVGGVMLFANLIA